MYHPNYPNGPPPHQQATGGYHQQMTNMPPHYPASQAGMPPGSHQMNPSINQQQMPYSTALPPNSPMSSAAMAGHPQQQQQMQMQIGPPTSNQSSQLTDSIKQQQQQMYMRPPMMSGKPGSYQSMSSYSQPPPPSPHQMPPGHHPANSPHHLPMHHQSPYNPYHHPAHTMVNPSSEQAAQQQYQMPPTSTANQMMNHPDYYAHMRHQQSTANNYPPSIYGFPPNGAIPSVYGKYPPTDNRQMMTNPNLVQQQQQSSDNLSTSQNEKLSTGWYYAI